MQKLKILHITHDMNIGGAEKVIWSLIKNTNTTRFIPLLLCIDAPIGPWGLQLKEEGFGVFGLTRKPGLNFFLAQKIRELIKQQNIDIIHCHQYTPYFYGLLGAVGTCTKVIFTEHGRFYPDIPSWKRKLVNPILQYFTSAIVSISEATKQALVTVENFSPQKIQVIYNGHASTPINNEQVLDITTITGLQQKVTVFGTVSRLDPIKNHGMMIKAFNEASKNINHLILLIVGDGPEKQTLQTLVQALNLEKKVFFTGFKPEPQALLNCMDIFLLPSLSEGTSMTLLEAMSYAKPSIATTVGGTPEIIEHNVSGILIDDVNDQAALSKAMIELAQNKSLRTKLGNNALSSFEKKFTITSMMQAYESLYSTLKQ